ncbi:glycosyltransferase [Microbulbifer sp. DLAB2-AF]|uniref:glycosyltransferase family 2 protein n=1 Tax=Microbulbifer sp. DLAB2-AF TaxID=3243395 RepID=UPI004039E0DD
MMEAIHDGFIFLSAQSRGALFIMFWIVIFLELPRYIFSFFTAVFFFSSRIEKEVDLEKIGKISVIIAGHNEEESIEKCVHSLWAQSVKPYEIIVVSDGSTDGTRKVMSSLLTRGLIQGAHATELRGGKASALNLGIRFCTGDIVITVDCDCSFEHHTMKEVLLPFEDPKVGVVSGNVFVRNPQDNLITAFQSIEYIISISLGRHALAMIKQMCCASGAYSGFRKTAIDQVGGFDSGGGEDLDITFRLRNYGWDIAFAPEAICYTDVPTNILTLIRQRLRWERDAVRLRYRKYAHFINPFKRRIKFEEFFHQFEFLIFNVIAAIALPIYLVWLFASYGSNAWFILIGAQIVLIMLDCLTFALAAYATYKFSTLPLWAFLIGYSILYVNLMRVVRLYAYVQEWIFRTSYADSFAPSKVHKVRE